ncbi:hypothetical protein DFH07DRAFT_936289 [Mycena maculata]|uniref:F-box domain-containing protein n=1 Tax=Mycena maculata TaxID=230809 RepID=A0AAD7NXR7_9AGAR|nr:hypothetical protein DFH07DRAFT_936289 [Mycena maculata]
MWHGSNFFFSLQARSPYHHHPGMVLTRRAYKSIIRWLPNEVLSEVMLWATQLDLVALCQTSRLINGLATPLLYHTISLGTIQGIERFTSSMRRHRLSKCHHVRRFRIKEILHISQNLVEEIASILPHLCHLTSLQFISQYNPFLEMLGDAHFPNLTDFRCFVPPKLSSSVPAFLNRHTTIQSLYLCRTDDDLVPTLDPIHLPNLEHISMLGSFVPSLVHNNKNIADMCIFWYPDDDDVANILAALSRMSSINHALEVRFDRSHEPWFIGHVAKHMSDVCILTCHGLCTWGGRMSTDDILQIADHLKNFTNLRVLEFLDFKEDVENLSESQRTERDLSIVTYWGGVCGPLFQIGLHGHDWEFRDTGWTKTAGSATPRMLWESHRRYLGTGGNPITVQEQ